MKNKEKYAKEIVEIACKGHGFLVDKNTNEVVDCCVTPCTTCLFSEMGDCCEARIWWAESEYIEKPVISKRDREFLEYIADEFIYIARNEDERLFLFANKAIKRDELGMFACDGLTRTLYAFNINFPMVKWEDDEPWLIEDLMKLAVVEDYE